MKETIGQRILAAVLSHQLGISMDSAFRLYVRRRQIDPSWEVVGAELLKHALQSGGEPAAMKASRVNVRRRREARGGAREGRGRSTE
jgi:hypothetical protein